MSRKLITLLLTVVLFCCAATPAFAANPDQQQTQTAETGVTTQPDERDTQAETGEPSAPANPGADEQEPLPPEEGAQPPADQKTDEEIQAEEEAAAAAAAEEAAKKKEEAAKKAAEKKEKKEKKYKQGLAAYIRSKNGKLSKSWSLTLAGYFISAGEKYNLDPKILMAVAQRESTFRAKATNPYGIKGMMQTSDALARKYGYKPSSLYKAKVSIDVGARYLGGMKKKFGNYTKALSAYVYGSYAVSKGRYSKASANAMLQIRRNINTYLKKHHYV